MKRRTKKNINLILKTIVVLALVFTSLFIAFKFILPFFPKIEIKSNQSIVVPLGQNFDFQKLREKLSEKGINFDSIDVSSNSGVVIGKVTGGPKVYFASDKDVDWQVSSLQLIISRLTIDNKKPNLIDLRFDKPIVKY